MANLTYQNAVDYAKQLIHNPPVTAVDSQICHMVNSRIWTAYPWTWTLGSLTAISLVDGQQDYSIAAGDALFYRPINLWITRTDLTPDDYVPLTITEHLPPELTRKVGWPNFKLISYEGSISKLRLTMPPEVTGSVVMRIDGDYQKTFAALDDAALPGSMIQPDHYFHVFTAGVLYFFYQFADDSRAGSLVIDQSGRRRYTGQLGIWNDLLREMMVAEDYKNGQAFEFPDNPLGASMGSGGTYHLIFGN